MFRILHPEYLLLLLLIPLIWWSAKRVRVLGKGRKQITLILRTLVILLFILALAEVEKVNMGEQMAVFFVIDRSSSIPPDEQKYSIAYIQEQIADIPAGDQAGFIFFGKEAAIQENPRENVTLNEYQTLVNDDGTNIEAALGLAMAAFPDGVQKRVVLITDGNQTEGNAEKAAQHLVANNIDLQILPLEYTYTQDVLVEEVNVPSSLREDEPFNIRVLVNAMEEGPGTIRLLENGQVIAEQDVEFKPGKNAYIFNQTIDTGGVYQYEAQIEAENDRRPSNNIAQNHALVRGTPRVLYVDSELESAQALASALYSEGINIELRSPGGIPSSLRELQAFESVIISNVAAHEITEETQTLLETAVRDIGLGLVMIGGPNSFGAGGYRQSPLERALPVNMDIKQRRIIPSGALVMIMHSCEIPQGNYWAQQISLRALDALGSQDYAGFLMYDSARGGDSWLFDLQQVGNKRAMQSAIISISNMTIGDMPSFATSMTMAYESLAAVQSNVKHMIILSDGDPQRPQPSLMEQITEEGITISTVCIAPHAPRDNQVMEAIAQLGGGRHYFVQNFNNLPQIFLKEAATVRRNLIIEETFTPAITNYSEILQGFNEGFPSLNGYVATSIKPEAETLLVTHEEDPLLATWRYGLGKSVAFTSEAKSRWASEWLNWPGYAKFWGQLVRWTLPTEENENFQVETSLEGDQVKVMVDALDPNGEFINNLDFQATNINPQFNTETFELKQTGPGRYEGTFSAEESGSYLVNLSYTGADTEDGYVTTGVSVPYSPEHLTTHQNETLLNNLKEITGNNFLTVQTSVFDHTLSAVGEMKPLWPLLLGLAIVFFFLDIAVRRVFFELKQVQAFSQRVWAWMLYPFTRQLAPSGPATDGMGQLMQAKSRAVEQSQTAKKSEFIDRLDQEKQEEIDKMKAEASQKEPIWHESKLNEPEPEKFKDEPQDSYTSALFRAKDRAQKGMKRKDDQK